MDVAKISHLVGVFQPAGWQQNIAGAGVLEKIEILDEDEGEITIFLRLPFPNPELKTEVELKLSSKVLLLKGVNKVHWQVSLDVATLSRCNNAAAVKGVKNIIAVASGKGGVGKSTTSVNLALALAHGGAKVGLLDADIYGPSLPTMVGAVKAKPVSQDGKLLDPVIAHGLHTMSLGFLVDENDATVWRGPMASRALGQLIYETQWPTLDYLVVDMPPGTGDIQLTMSSDVPVSGAVVVTTPQNLALKDAQKGISMFDKVKVPVIGVIENMSYHECDNCGHHSHLFGEEGGKALAANAKVELVGHLPLDGNIGHDVDNGRPTLVSQPDSSAAKAYLDIAVRCAINLNKTNQSIPSLVIGE